MKTLGRELDSSDVLYTNHTSRKRTRFAVVDSEGLTAVHEGLGLTLDAVLAFEAPAEPEENLGGDYDLSVFEGSKLVAVIHRRDGQVPEVTRLD